MGDKYGKKGLANQRVTTNSKYSHVSSTLQGQVGRTTKQVENFSKLTNYNKQLRLRLIWIFVR